jgi:NADH dehydrogenase FAD-containing subunit
VSFSAMVTLAHAGADVVALVTDLPRQQSYAAFALGALARWRVPVWTSTALRRVHGRDRLTAVDVADVRTGAVRRVECETLVFTGDWIPDHELARTAGIAIDPGTRGPAVDTSLETAARNVFAAGNLVHAAEIADVAALDGVHAARHIAAALSGREPMAAPLDGTPADAGPQSGAPPARRLPVAVESPLAWISPNAIRLIPPGATPVRPPRGRFLLRSQVFQHRATLEVRQGDRVLARQRARLIPGRPVHLDTGWLAGVRPSAGPVLVTLARG